MGGFCRHFASGSAIVCPASASAFGVVLPSVWPFFASFCPYFGQHPYRRFISPKEGFARVLDDPDLFFKTQRQAEEKISAGRVSTAGSVGFTW
jgi:hypothetical protein